MEDRRLPANERVERLKRRYRPYLLLAVYIGSFIGMFFAVLTIDRNLWSATIWGLAFAAIEAGITLIADRIIGVLFKGKRTMATEEPGGCPANESPYAAHKKSPGQRGL